MNILITGGSGFVGSSFLEFYQTVQHPYIVYAPSHQELDLMELDQVKIYIEENKIEYVIHTACPTIRNYATVGMEHVYNNLLVFENLIIATQHCKKLINFGSGAEFDKNTNVKECVEGDIYNICPKEYGGFLKNVVTKRLLDIKTPKCFNLRFFGGFGPLELNDRFIKSNLLNVLHHQQIVIHKNRYFDFVYVDDLAMLTLFILANRDIPQNLNCVYKDKMTLLDIAYLIKDITDSDSEIIIEEDGMDLNYTGDGTLLDSLGLPLIGLKEGIKQTYERLKK